MSEPLNLVPLDAEGLSARSGPPPTLLPADSAEAAASLAAAMSQTEPGPGLKAVAGRWPSFVEVWARLAEWALDRRLDVEGFAFSRTAYHRGLDRLRHNGWRGTGPVPWSHHPNRGVLRAIHALMRASAALGEADEAERCRQLLLDSDPGDPFGVRGREPDPGSQQSGVGDQG